jgi:hypothetical protein
LSAVTSNVYYLKVAGSTLDTGEAKADLANDYFATPDLIKWGNTVIKHVLSLMNVSLNEQEYIAWTFVRLPTANPIAFATSFGRTYLMVFDVIWWNKMSEGERNHVFLHELAHIIGFIRESGRSKTLTKILKAVDFTEGHGYEWKRTMKKLQQAPNRYINVKHDAYSRPAGQSVLQLILQQNGQYFLQFSAKNPKPSKGSFAAITFIWTLNLVLVLLCFAIR